MKPIFICSDPIPQHVYVRCGIKRIPATENNRTIYVHYFFFRSPEQQKKRNKFNVRRGHKVDNET